MPAGSHLSKTLTSLAGEFSVAAQLCLRGFVASLTLKNYPEVDIFCFNPADERQATIQVKTIVSGNAYFLPERIAAGGPTFVFVRFTKKEAEFWIVPAAAVEAISTTVRDTYLAARPNVNAVQPRMIATTDIEQYRNDWDKIVFR